MAQHFLRVSAEESQKRVKDFTQEALHLMNAFEFKYKNAQELKEMIKRAIFSASTTFLDVRDISNAGVRFAEDESIESEYFK